MRVVLIAGLLGGLVACTTGERPVESSNSAAAAEGSRAEPRPSPFEPPAEIDPPPTPTPGEDRGPKP